MRAAIYLRISQDRTGEEAGVTRQLEDCQALVEAMGWTLIGAPFKDNDSSAVNRKKPRKDYLRLLAAIRAGEIDAVVAWHTDRLYRKLEDLQELIDAIEKQNVVVRTVQAGELDLSTATGRGMARILGSVATMEGELKAERWHGSVRQRREQGLVHNFGPRLFGYHRDADPEKGEGTATPCQQCGHAPMVAGAVCSAEADVVRAAAASLIAGESARNVVRRLNERDVRTTRGNPFTLRGLTAVMQNRRLTGASMLNGDVVGVGQWEPILDEETFEQVQAIYSVRRTNGPRPPRVALLVGLIHCGLDGCQLPLMTARRSSDKVRIYQCKGPTGCNRIAIRAEETEAYVEAVAREWLADARVRERAEQLRAASGEAVTEIIELEERLLELEAQLDEPGTPVSAITRAMQRTQERIDALHAAGAAAPAPEIPRAGAWPTDLARRAQLVALVVERVDVDPVAVRGSNRFDYDRIRITQRDLG